MNKKSLFFFNSEELSSIINELGSVPRIFNSEAQFQFELAWKINEKFDCKVKLEELSRIYDKKKDYTDIILEKDGLRIAIELKYKTAFYVNPEESIYLKDQGAADLGAYDFLWDVHRIQVLNGLEEGGNITMPCQKGYAVILTNDAHYWKDATIKDTINRDFLIGGSGEGNGMLTKGKHQWYTLDGKIGIPAAAKYREDAINLTKNYFFHWITYHTIDTNKKNKDFKYMIVDIAVHGKQDDVEAIEDMKNIIVVEIAKRVERKYGFYWIKCVDLVMQSSWWYKNYIAEELSNISVDELFVQVCKEIDSNDIF